MLFNDQSLCKWRINYFKNGKLTTPSEQILQTKAIGGRCLILIRIENKNITKIKKKSQRVILCVKFSAHKNNLQRKVTTVTRWTHNCIIIGNILVLSLHADSMPRLYLVIWYVYLMIYVCKAVEKKYLQHSTSMPTHFPAPVYCSAVTILPDSMWSLTCSPSLSNYKHKNSHFVPYCPILFRSDAWVRLNNHWEQGAFHLGDILSPVRGTFGDRRQLSRRAQWDARGTDETELA